MYGDIVSSRATVYMPFAVYLSAMDLKASENVITVASHSLVGLRRHDLISTFAYGQPPLLQRYAWAQTQRAEIHSDGLIVSPSPFGAELFMYVHGKLDYLSENDFFGADTELEPSAEVTIPEGALKLSMEEKYQEDDGLLDGSF